MSGCLYFAKKLVYIFLKVHMRGSAKRPGSNSEFSFSQEETEEWSKLLAAAYTHTGRYPGRGDETNVKYFSTKDGERFLRAWRYRLNTLARVKRKSWSLNASWLRERWEAGLSWGHISSCWPQLYSLSPHECTGKRWCPNHTGSKGTVTLTYPEKTGVHRFRKTTKHPL